MSRLTATQVVEKGDYLDDDFNASSLTVSQLLGVLNYHDIRYPTPYSKPKLVQIFNDEIRPRAAQFRAQRIAPEPSDDGITDGMTGEPINRQRKAPTRPRSSRRASRREEEDSSSPVRPEPSKRRRPSTQATPRASSRRRSAVAAEPVVVEDSENSEPEEPPRKVGKRRKQNEQKSRVSQAEESAWEDNNIFQSGPESSPLRTPGAKARRSSVASRKSRKSTSVAPPSAPNSPTRSSLPPESKFEPQLPEEVIRENKVVAPRWLSQSREGTPSGTRIEGEYLAPLKDEDTTSVENEETADSYGFLPDVEVATDEAIEDEQIRAISQRLSEDPSTVMPAEKKTSRFSFFNLFCFSIFLACLHSFIEHKTELAKIGFCDPGRTENAISLHLKTKKLEEETCRLKALNSTNPEGEDCAPPDIIPFLHPMECIPCPQHATCTQYSVTCEKGFLLRTYNPFPVHSHGIYNIFHPEENYLSKVRTALSDPAPYFGPECVADPQRQQNINKVGRAMTSWLANERGRRLCEGDFSRRQTIPDNEGGEAKRWGVEVNNLKEAVRPRPSPPNYEDHFEEAIQQVTSYSDMFISEDANGVRYIAHTTPNLTWSCMVTVRVGRFWLEWRTTFISLAFLIPTYFYWRWSRSVSQKRQQRVAALVQAALEALQEQEIQYHTDAASTPVPYFASNQLRDYILQEEHSTAKRQKLWALVSRVVEENANVRVTQEEADGDETRVWRWVGRARGPRKSGVQPLEEWSTVEESAT